MSDIHSPQPYKDRAVLFETDWLASTPVFFNQRTGLASTKIQELIASPADLRFHLEGLYNYLDFGYSVFGQTPVEDVQFLTSAARLVRDHLGHLQVEQLPDPIEYWWDYRLSEEDIIELIKERVQGWEASLPSDQEIVLPLSGGFDSRLLLWCLRDKSRVRAYTYGLSNDQHQSIEIVHAKAVANLLGVRWERIPLGDFHNYFQGWDAEFGISTHAHGMYHFEFYAQISRALIRPQALLSGLGGDMWAGKIPYVAINNPDELGRLGYTHGLRADPSRLKSSVLHDRRSLFWSKYSYLLRDHRFQIVTTVRLKLMLISYLMRVPRLFGFHPWTPYLDIDIAMAMLNLSSERRKNRDWQRNFFSKVGLDVENHGFTGSHRNTLDYQAIKRQPLNPLNIGLLTQLFDESYLNWINNNITASFFSEAIKYSLGVPKVSGVLRRLGLKDHIGQAYSAYLTLKPIESLLLQRGK